jgi:hydrogenase-1 operon protein HyaE
MPQPLIDRLTGPMGWQRLQGQSDVAAFTRCPGAHWAFLPGDPERTLESADVAVILPELRMAFQDRFDCAAADDAVEEWLRTDTGVLKTPGLIFHHDGALIGASPKVRDWDDGMARTARILSVPQAAA